MSQRLRFKLEAEAPGSKARAARFQTLHNEIRTPLFMPVGTRATVRAQTVETLKASGSQILLANTYHLLLRPGPEVFRKFDGIHRFMNWNGSVLTDSGGFQIFSLPNYRVITEEGATFTSYFEEKRVFLSPEVSIATQKAIGSDIMMALDQCIPSTAGHGEALEAMERTHRWARRSLDARGDSPQALFGIVQGACVPELRRQSAAAITEMEFDGFAIGGLAVGESKAEREDVTELTAELLPKHLPRYLMGVGTPIDLLEAVHRGVDMFDCIIPTMYAQQGVVFTSRGRVELRRGIHSFSEDKLDPSCSCPTCASYSRAYLHFLVKSEEVLGWHLLGVHNIHFYHQLMREMRTHILAGSFADFYRTKRVELEWKDLDYPIKHPKRRKTPKKHSRTLGDYELQANPEGTHSIRQISSGETMHSVNDPDSEARKLYLEQSRFEERVRDAAAPELVVWDVGLGAATNAMAVVRKYQELFENGEKLRPVHLISFENDLDSLKLALMHRSLFRHLRHAAPEALVQEGSWSGVPGLRWSLFAGDFRQTMDQSAPPDVIFYDPFSYKVDSPLWTLELFKRLYGRCEGRAVELFTYSASTAARAALLSAGFLVARGAPTGPKADTTIALTALAYDVRRSLPSGAPELLLSDWLERWSRSGARYPSDVTRLEADALREFEKSILTHPQFATHFSQVQTKRISDHDL